MNKNFRMDLERLDLVRKTFEQSKESVCKIYTERIFNDELIKVFGTGFFLEFFILDIPFNRCLITNNHILNEENIKNGRQIKIVYGNKEKIIEITENRRVFTNKELDYTLIEILKNDKINHFLNYKENLFELEKLELREFLMIEEGGLSCTSGIIKTIKNNIIYLNCCCRKSSSGAPLIDIHSSSILGIYIGVIYEKNHNFFELATPISSIIKDIKIKLTIITSFNYTEKYKDLEIIGKGNFGTVYKGKIKDKTDKDNYIAIKVINKDEQKNRLRTVFNKNNIEDEFNLYVINSIENEVKNMTICMKDNINSIKFYELYDIEKEYAIVMELCDDNLQNILNKRNTGFNKDEIYDILSQLNNTFKIMSQNIIIHRDLKLENILVKYLDNDKSKFIVKLTDYGVSRKMMSLSKKCKSYAGTLLTMSPEILAGEEYDNETDLWSLGVIIYQLFFKKYPYDGEREVAIYKKINELGQKILKETGDKKLDDLIRKLLVNNPKKRVKWKDYFNHPFFKK